MMVDAKLSEEGKKAWGGIFPDGVIPLKHINSTRIGTDDAMNPDVYFVDWEALPVEQFNKILDKLSQKFNAPYFNVLEEVHKRGLPIQSKYIASVGPVDIRFFI